jgi:hypothetical protein
MSANTLNCDFIYKFLHEDYDKVTSRHTYGSAKKLRINNNFQEELL